MTTRPYLLKYDGALVVDKTTHEVLGLVRCLAVLADDVRWDAEAHGEHRSTWLGDQFASTTQAAQAIWDHHHP